MKKVMTSVFALFTLTATFASAATPNPEKAPGFASSVYTSTATQQLHVAVEKQEGKKVQIRLVNEAGEVLAEETVGKKKNSYRARFVINQLSDGTYKLLITDGTTTESRQLNLTTNTPVVAPARVVTVQ